MVQQYGLVLSSLCVPRAAAFLAALVVIVVAARISVRTRSTPPPHHYHLVLPLPVSVIPRGVPCFSPSFFVPTSSPPCGSLYCCCLSALLFHRSLPRRQGGVTGSCRYRGIVHACTPRIVHLHRGLSKMLAFGTETGRGRVWRGPTIENITTNSGNTTDKAVLGMQVVPIPVARTGAYIVTQL